MAKWQPRTDPSPNSSSSPERKKNKKARGRAVDFLLFFHKPDKGKAMLRFPTDCGEVCRSMPGIQISLWKDLNGILKHCCSLKVLPSFFLSSQDEANPCTNHADKHQHSQGSSAAPREAPAAGLKVPGPEVTACFWFKKAIYSFWLPKPSSAPVVHLPPSCKVLPGAKSWLVCGCSGSRLLEAGLTPLMGGNRG